MKTPLILLLSLLAIAARAGISTGPGSGAANSTNANTLNGIPASGFVRTTNALVSDGGLAVSNGAAGINPFGISRNDMAGIYVSGVDTILNGAGAAIFTASSRTSPFHNFTITDSYSYASNLMANHFFGDATAAQIPNVQDYIARAVPQVPYMYSSWYDFGTSPTAAGLRTKYQQILTNGLFSAGCNIIVIDDGWMTSNRVGGALTCDTTKFPGGMQDFANELHTNGFKLCLYTSFGDTTCGGFAATPPRYVQQDVMQFARWGVDIIRVDSCNPLTVLDSTSQPYYSRYLAGMFSQAIAQIPTASGFDGTNIYAMGLYCSLDRTHPTDTTTAIPDWIGITQVNSWEDPASDISGSIASVQNQAVTYLSDAWAIKPGHYPSINAMHTSAILPGVPVWSTNVLKTALGLNAMLSGIIVFNGDFVNLSFWTNAEVLAVNRNAAAIPATLCLSNATQTIWNKPLGFAQMSTNQNPRIVGGQAIPASGFSGQSNCVVMVNSDSTSASMSASWQALGFETNAVYCVRDLWAGADLGRFTNSFTQTILATNSGMFLFVRVPGYAPKTIPIKSIMSDNGVYASGGFSASPYFVRDMYAWGNSGILFVHPPDICSSTSLVTTIWLQVADNHSMTMDVDSYTFPNGGRTVTTMQSGVTRNLTSGMNTITWTNTFPNVTAPREVYLRFSASTNLNTIYLVHWDEYWQ